MWARVEKCRGVNLNGLRPGIFVPVFEPVFS